MATDRDQITAAQLRARGWLKWSYAPETIGAFVAEMDFGVAQPILDELHRAVSAEVFGYLTDGLTTSMAAACADYLAHAFGWQVAPAAVRPVPDVLAGLVSVIEHFTPPSSPVIVPTPAYMPFLTVPGLMGREIVEVPMALDGDGYRYDLDALAAAITVPGQLVLVCNPHNPTGRVLERAELSALVDVIDARGARVFADEIHAPLVYPGGEHIPYASLGDTAARQAITAVSASKAWNIPGLKCAQLIFSAEADLARWHSRAISLGEHGTANLGVVAATAAYRNGRPWLADTVTYLDANRKMLSELVAEHLPGVGYRQPEGTYLAWFDCRETGIAHAGRFFADNAAVTLVDGMRCGAAGTGFVRYNFATPTPIMVETIAAMGVALGEASSAS